MSAKFTTALFIALTSISTIAAETSQPEATEVTAAVEAFHKALAHGDAKAAMDSLAPDAVILESGSAETRDQYEKHHLAEDIAFLRVVHSTNSVLAVHVTGGAGWVASTSRANGTFNGKPVNSVGTELAVLTSSPSGWRIRAIHWSSHEAKDAPTGESY